MSDNYYPIRVGEFVPVRVTYTPINTGEYYPWQVDDNGLRSDVPESVHRAVDGLEYDCIDMVLLVNLRTGVRTVVPLDEVTGEIRRAAEWNAR